ncbi:MAG: transglycosylase domain-containing protein [Clostridia bacterium]|nr:transglycosylase domain-containing protein [Clostridia bacterium]
MAKKSNKKRMTAGEWFATLPQRMLDWVKSLFHPTAAQKAKRRRTWRGVGNTLLGVVLVGVITTTIVVGVVVVFWVTNFDAEAYCPDLTHMSGERSIIWIQDDSGNFVPYHNLEGGNSVWVDLEEIPLRMQNAVIAIEDERFRDHEGVDWKRTAGAMINLVANRVLGIGNTEYGGSTITQQLIKVTTQNKDHSVKRKVNEILAASYMESTKYTKDEILEGYLNNVPLTGDLVGVGIGARAYFGKELQELSVAECAVLASITNNPSMYDPYAHPENVRQRQQLVLGKMYELGFITKDEYLNALNEELVFRSSTVKQDVQDYYVDLVVEDVANDLMLQYGYTYNYAINLVYYGGLNIYSAEDPELQAKVQAIYANEKNYPDHRKGDEEEPQAAFFCVDYNGKVIATVGGRGEKTANRVLNRSTQSVRSPGSSMKPLTSYGPAIVNNLVHYSSMLRDAPIVLPNGSKWPHNYEAKYTPDNGDVLLGIALQKSLNTTAARLVEQMTPLEVYNFLIDTFKVSTLVQGKTVNGSYHSDINLAPLALGALTDGVTARDMAAAYAVFGSGGYYNEPYTYYYVTRASDEPGDPHLLDKGSLEYGGCNTEIAMDPQSAYVMVSLMRRVVEVGTAYSGIGNQWQDWQVFGKTGTSESEKDVYFCGGTAYYSASSWFGYDNNQELSKSQTGYAKSLWNKAMKVLHENKQIKDFTMPDGVEVLTYCTKTGLLATPDCKKTDTGVYKTSFKPDTCTCGQAVTPPPVAPTIPTTPVTPSGTSTTGTESTTGSTAGSTAATLPTTGTTAAPVTPGGDDNNGIPTP